MEQKSRAIFRRLCQITIVTNSKAQKLGRSSVARVDTPICSINLTPYVETISRSHTPYRVGNPRLDPVKGRKKKTEIRIACSAYCTCDSSIMLARSRYSLLVDLTLRGAGKLHEMISSSVEQ